jgi:hypothetical protein
MLKGEQNNQENIRVENCERNNSRKYFKTLGPEFTN